MRRTAVNASKIRRSNDNGEIPEFARCIVNFVRAFGKHLMHPKIVSFDVFGLVVPVSFNGVV